MHCLIIFGNTLHFPHEGLVCDALENESGQTVTTHLACDLWQLWEVINMKQNQKPDFKAPSLHKKG